ncbi:hypothetical protein SKAU_G00168960 [Synaphobranchus kaupii]|uniref:Uncharacterized protein n=1 Tax=Synaphobranchus kaupii TaxID=118154 RepID=A0A9Q1FK59_SYNKA|nr:hypothetical protein SKAU_G00168960 [Synaphobranchus kaupii]
MSPGIRTERPITQHGGSFNSEMFHSSSICDTPAVYLLLQARGNGGFCGTGEPSPALQSPCNVQRAARHTVGSTAVDSVVVYDKPKPSKYRKPTLFNPQGWQLQNWSFHPSWESVAIDTSYVIPYGSPNKCLTSLRTSSVTDAQTKRVFPSSQAVASFISFGRARNVAEMRCRGGERSSERKISRERRKRRLWGEGRCGPLPVGGEILPVPASTEAEGRQTLRAFWRVLEEHNHPTACHPPTASSNE